ncbi:hypothetical protein [Alkalicoccus luteus]|uniref:Uncharacterized protein n=1 Tax=Alkalicoccus luteus TaxID=1237094 RepID=A0A969TTC9_9BACI|nr:hypothetical protein [Alkalicoccus luteus]NJP37523.1 hypothetical protein [Alkalicoccus luteus]
MPCYAAAGVLLETGLAGSVQEAQQIVLRYRPEAVIQEEALDVLRKLYEST